MRPFSQRLIGSYKGSERRPLASEALGAVLFDQAGITPEEVELKRSVIHVPDVHAVDAVNAALFRVHRGRAVTKHQLAKAIEAKEDLAGKILILDDIAAMRTDWWTATAGEHGLGVVFVVTDGSIVDAQVKAWVHREVTLDETDAQPIIPDVIRLVTGQGFVVRENDYRGATAEDLRAALGPRTNAREAIDAIKRIVAARKVKEEAEMAERGGKAEVKLEAVPLASAAADVVKKLSEMTGFGEAGAWGLRLAEDLRDYASGEIGWRDVDRGVLLVGPPGSGKTTFAKALAAECGVPLVPTTYNEWQGNSGGDAMAKGLTKLFDGWRKKAAVEGPFVLFVDEIDSLGARQANGHNETWFMTIINAWLQFLDGAVPRDGIVVVAATNHIDRVDAALRRPGRLDRVVELPYPGVDALAGIIRHHLGPDAVIDEGELRIAARACRGKSPADIELICREARGMARRWFRRKVAAYDVVDILGAQRMQRARSAATDAAVCVHEASHAVIALALGWTVEHVDADAGHAKLPSREIVEERGMLEEMVIGMAGIAGEEVVLGHRSTSGGADIEGTTRNAIVLHARVGLGIAGKVALDVGRGPVLGTPLHAAVRATTDAAHARAMRLCRLHRANIQRVATALAQERYLEAGELKALFRSPLLELSRGKPDEWKTYPDDYLERATFVPPECLRPSPAALN